MMKSLKSKLQMLRSSFEIRIPRGSLTVQVSPDNNLTATSRRFILNHFGFEFKQMSIEGASNKSLRNTWVYQIDASENPLFNELKADGLNTYGEKDAPKSTLLLAKSGENWSFVFAGEDSIDLKDWDSVWVIGEVTNTYGQGLLNQGDEAVIKVLSANTYMAKVFYALLGAAFVFSALNVCFVFFPGPYDMPAIPNKPILKQYHEFIKLSTRQ